MITAQSRRGRIALMVAHCAGMVDLVALPVWVGALIGHYGFDPQQAGGLATLFLAAAVMAVAALVALFAFPHADGAPAGDSTPPTAAGAAPMPRAVWFGIVGIGGMGLVQAMTFAFLERVGIQRGFGLAAVTGVLVALSLVNLFPAALAALLEKRWSPRAVLLSGAALQALLVALIMQSRVFAPYAAAASVFAAVMIFTHTSRSALA